MLPLWRAVSEVASGRPAGFPRPKQFLDITGSGRSLIRQTVDRFLKMVPAEHIFIVTNGIYKDLVKQHLPELTDNQILCEPSRNNTAPCVAYTAFKLHALDPDANFIIAPSDHLIQKERCLSSSTKPGTGLCFQTGCPPDTGHSAHPSGYRLWVHSFRRQLGRTHPPGPSVYGKAAPGKSQNICCQWRIPMECRHLYLESRIYSRSLPQIPAGNLFHTFCRKRSVQHAGRTSFYRCSLSDHSQHFSRLCDYGTCG